MIGKTKVDVTNFGHIQRKLSNFNIAELALAGVAHDEADASSGEVRDERVVRRTDLAEPFRRRARRGMRAN